MSNRNKGLPLVYKYGWVLVPFVVPEGCYVCPDCEGRGEIRHGYDGGHDRDFSECMLCEGKGYLNEEDLKFWERHGSETAKAKIALIRANSISLPSWLFK